MAEPIRNSRRFIRLTSHLWYGSQRKYTSDCIQLYRATIRYPRSGRILGAMTYRHIFSHAKPYGLRNRTAYCRCMSRTSISRSVRSSRWGSQRLDSPGALLRRWPTLEALQKARPATLRSFSYPALLPQPGVDWRAAEEGPTGYVVDLECRRDPARGGDDPDPGGDPGACEGLLGTPKPSLPPKRKAHSLTL